MTAKQSRRVDRIKGAAAAVIVQVLLGYALITGLAVRLPDRVTDDLKLFGLTREVPPPVEKIRPHPVRTAKVEGAASPPNVRSRATEIIAPIPVVPVTVPPPVVTAPVAGIGADPSSGSADVPGPGTGSGGEGDGTGSGHDGNGDGGRETPPRQRRGHLKYSDNPTLSDTGGVGGTVSVRYAIETNGRATGCIVTGSSGNAALDQTTCRLIEQRFRFAPARDARGRAVRSVLVQNHEWVIEQMPPPER